MNEQDYLTGDMEAALDDAPSTIRENVDLTPSPDSVAQRMAIGVIIRQQAIQAITKRNRLNATADWTGYDG